MVVPGYEILVPAASVADVKGSRRKHTLRSSDAGLDIATEQSYRPFKSEKWGIYELGSSPDEPNVKGDFIIVTNTMLLLVRRNQAGDHL